VGSTTGECCAYLEANIKKLRKERGLAHERLALEAGADRTVVGKIERQVSNPSLEILVKLAVVLQVPITELFSEWPHCRYSLKSARSI